MNESYRGGALSLALLFAVLVPATASADECAGVRMPDRLRVQGEVLQLNGMGLREATMFHIDVMVVGLYVPTVGTDAAAILEAHGPKRLRMQLLRDASSSRMATGMRDALESTGEEDGVPRLTALLPDELPEGTRIELTQVPDRGLEVRVNGERKGWVRDEAFARAIFDAFLGPSSPDRSMTEGLLGGDCE